MSDLSNNGHLKHVRILFLQCGRKANLPRSKTVAMCQIIATTEPARASSRSTSRHSAKRDTLNPNMRTFIITILVIYVIAAFCNIRDIATRKYPYEKTTSRVGVDLGVLLVHLALIVWAIILLWVLPRNQ